MRGVIINIKFETTSALFAKNNILALEVFYCKKKKKNPQLLSQAKKKKFAYLSIAFTAPVS